MAKLIKSNHPTLVDVIKENKLFRGEWYLDNVPYHIEDKPKISNWESNDCKILIENINNNSHIRKAIFVYDKNLNCINKYDGVTLAAKALNLNHLTIKTSALSKKIYNGYLFSYERLN
jgi:hypothetical protein